MKITNFIRLSVAVALGGICVLAFFYQTARVKEPTEMGLDSYTVLTEKALSAQADRDTAIWSLLLAEDIVLTYPDTGTGSKTTVKGKSNALSHWAEHCKLAGVKTIQLSGFNYAPIDSKRVLPVSGLSGVHVFSISNSIWSFADGQTAELTMSVYCHFNQDKLIDSYYVNYDRTAIVQAIAINTVSHLPNQ
jgi:hypothetical protein